jgi:hypothetical protein
VAVVFSGTIKEAKTVAKATTSKIKAGTKTTRGA